MKEAKELLKIIKSFLEKRQYISKEDIDEKKLYLLAKKHRVSNFLNDWAKENCKDNYIKEQISKDYEGQIFRDTNENVELENMLQSFEKANIQTLLFKGPIMKKVYPQAYMRQMCDIDILTSHEDFKKASKIMQDLGYEKFYDYEKHLIFSKKPFFMVELHRNLLRNRDVGSEYLNNDVWNLCENYENYNYIKRLSIENAYFFCIIHLMGHFKLAGISIRDILDVYLYNEKYKNEFDYEKLNRLFDKYDISVFEKSIKDIAYKWFGNEEINQFDEIEKFILKGQSITNQVNYRIGENQGKIKYLIKLFFPGYKIMKEKYPILRKAPILLPITWITRFLKDVFSKETTVKERLNTIKLIKKADSEDVKKIQEIYNKLGIKGEEK